MGPVPLRKALPRNASEYRKTIIAAEKKMRPHAHFKTSQYGSTWMDDFVQQRQGVNLCLTCVQHYWHWWCTGGRNYRPDWSPLGAKRGDCDGCGTHLRRLTPFYPEEKYEALRVKARYLSKGAK